MRIFKGIIGWLSFLCLLAAPASIILWLWALAWPFLHGATITRLPWPETEALSRSIAQNGIGPSTNSLLRAYVTRPTPPASIETGLAAAMYDMQTVNVWFASATPPARGLHSSCAALVVDAKDRMVIAAYPAGLIGSQDAVAGMSRISAVRVYASQAGSVQTQSIFLRDGKPIGYLSVFTNGNLLTEDIKDYQKTPGWLANLVGMTPNRDMSGALIAGIVFLTLFALLLPIWVGMDSSWRGMRPFAWGILVLLTNVIGLLAYLIARLPAPQPCSNCGEKVLGKYVRCPACGVAFIQRCPKCGMKMKPGWQFCPRCKDVDEPQEPTPQSMAAIPPEPVASKTEPKRGSADVLVTDSETRLPLRGVNIAVHGPCELSGSTNQRGGFTLHRLVGGEYTIQASKDGYTAEKRTLRTTGSASEMVSIALKPLPGKILGRAADCVTGRGISGVTVSLDTTRIDRSATSDEGGAYILEDIPQGDYTMIAESSGHEVNTRLIEVRPGRSVIADLGLTPVGCQPTAEEEKTDGI